MARDELEHFRDRLQRAEAEARELGVLNEVS